MSTPSRILNITSAGFVRLSFAHGKKLATKQFSLSDTTPVKLVTDVSGLTRRRVLIRAHLNPATDPNVTIHIGGSNVTSSNGFPLYELDEIELDLNPTAEIYAVLDATPTNELTVGLMEIE